MTRNMFIRNTLIILAIGSFTLSLSSCFYYRKSSDRKQYPLYRCDYRNTKTLAVFHGTEAKYSEAKAESRGRCRKAGQAKYCELMRCRKVSELKRFKKQ